MKYGKELLAELNQSLFNSQNVQKERQERIDNWQTDSDDCATSIRMSSHNDSIDRMKIEILENGGLSEFECLCDLKGNVVSEKMVDGRYGACWLIKDEYQEEFGKFVGEPRKESTLTRKGLKWGTIKKAAWVSFKSNGSGMMGAYTGQAVVFPSRVNYWTGE